MAENQLLDEHTQAIIKRYTKVYKIFFQYSLFLIPFIAGSVAAFFLQSSDTLVMKIPSHQAFKSYSYYDNIYKAGRISDQIGPILTGFGEIKILGGELQVNDNMLIGRNNLITLGGIILPNKPYVMNFGFTGNSETFTTGYDVKDLKRVLDNWILANTPHTLTANNSAVNEMFFENEDISERPATNMEEVLAQLRKKLYFHSQILTTMTNTVAEDAEIYAEKQDFIEKYTLSCLKTRKAYDGFCNTNLALFIEDLPDLALDGGRDSINSIALAIRENNQKGAFCANIMANVLRQAVPSSQLDNIMNDVCIDYNQRYTTIKSFLKVQNELDSIVSEAVIPNNLDVNIFKLTSLRQKIAQQQSKKGLDTATVVAYIRFLDAFIHQSSTPIPQFYLDAAYYFNNAYLKNMLKSLSINSLNPTVKSDVANLLEQINSINKGNESLGIGGLEKMVKNAATIQSTVVVGNTTPMTIAYFEQVFKDTIAQYPEIHATEIETDEVRRTARIVGSLKYTNEEKEQKSIVVIIDFAYKEGQFTVTALRTLYNPMIDELLVAYMKKNPHTSLATLAELIKSNSDYVKTIITLCDVLGTQPLFMITECTNQTSTFAINGTGVQLSFDQNTVTQATSPDEARNTYLAQALKNGLLTKERLTETLQTLPLIGKENAEQEELSSVENEKLAIISKFKTFLGVEPKAIMFKNNKRIVIFDLANYNFATVVTIEKNYRLAPLVVSIQGEIITIAPFSLSLRPMAKTRITQFVDGPLEYIKSIDTASYEKIRDIMKPKETSQ